MIPHNLKKEHVLLAARWFDENGYRGMDSRYYLVVVNRTLYFPRLLISKANYFANGYDLPSDEFVNAQETVSFLERLGFRVIQYDESSGWSVCPLSELLCCKCGHVRRRDHKYCESCGSANPSAHPQLVPRKGNYDAVTGDSRIRDLPNSLTRLAGMLEDFFADVTVEKGFLIYETFGHRLYIIDRDDEYGHHLDVADPIDVHPAISFMFSVMGKEKYTELLDGMMEGPTRCRLEWSEGRIRWIEFGESMDVAEDDFELFRRFNEVVVEVVNSCTNVHNFLIRVNKETGRREYFRPAEGPHDHMYV